MTLTTAALIACKLHAKDRKKCAGDVPFVEHVAHVADILAQYGQSKETVIAGYLHHLYDSNNVEIIEQCRQKFSNKVMDILDILRIPKGLSKVESKRYQVERVNNILNKSVTDPTYRAAGLIILADKMSNLYTFEQQKPQWSDEICLGYKKWCFVIVRNLVGIDRRFDIDLARYFRNEGITYVEYEELEDYYALLN